MAKFALSAYRTGYRQQLNQDDSACVNDEHVRILAADKVRIDCDVNADASVQEEVLLFRR